MSASPWASLTSLAIRALLGLALGVPSAAFSATAREVEFNIPAQSADQALLAFSKQAEVEVLFSFDDLSAERSTRAVGRFFVEDALNRLLRSTAYVASRREDDKFVITRSVSTTGAVQGRLVRPNGQPAPEVRVLIPEIRREAFTNSFGEFKFLNVPVGTYDIHTNRDGFHPLEISRILIVGDRITTLASLMIKPAENATQLAPMLVEGRISRRGPYDFGPTHLEPRRAGGNLDLRRTENDVLPFVIYDRDRIARSGVVNLNEFLQREILDSDAVARPPEQDGSADSFTAGSSNLTLRGFATDETIVLVNGRRLPEVLTGGSAAVPPDVNFVPLSLVEQVQVLPASAAALYNGDAVGGVINIILRPDGDHETTEITATYTNATEGFDAGNWSTSLLHSETLLGGRLRLRLNANFVDTMPPTESELKYHGARLSSSPPLDEPLFRATPNIRSAEGLPLFGPDTPTVTSVAPGADGSGGLLAFSGREGMRNLALYESPGILATSLNSIDYPYGRRQRRELYFGSLVLDVTDWFQFGLDAAYGSTLINRGMDVFTADLEVAENSPFNPFGREILVSLNETPSQLGENFNEAQLEFYSIVGSGLISLPWKWELILDAQYARNSTRYRGVADVDRDRWQELVDRGDYNPLRDTQQFAPPDSFLDEVLIYNGHRDEFATLGDYETVDATLRFTNESLRLPTGRSVFTLGSDYRLTNLENYTAEQRYGDGTLARPPVRWRGRTIERVSIFSELKTPLLPTRWLPWWLHRIDANLAVRYFAADTANESNFAPTVGFKFDFAGGLALRGSFTNSNRFPTPLMSQRLGTGVESATGIDYVQIYDPRRNEIYDAEERTFINPNLRTESAITQSVGLIFHTGERHQLRAAIDFFDTQKTDEIASLDATALMNLESTFPDLVVRGPASPDEPGVPGRVTSLLTGATNLSRRHSQNWNASLDYSWTDFLGGTLDLRTRLVYFQRYNRELFPNSPVVDEIRNPSGSAAGLLKYRSNFGLGWSNSIFSFGLDGLYFHSRRLPEAEWASQGTRSIDPFWQFDTYFQADIGHWLLPETSRWGIRGQIRINNVFSREYPFYANEASGAGVQPYGDWRGRTISTSLTATF